MARVLRKAFGLAERSLTAGTLHSRAPLGRCRSILPLGGRVCAGLSARPLFAARREVMLQLMRLATQCRDSWVRRQGNCPHVATAGRPFLYGLFPTPPQAPPPLLPYARRPP